MNSVLLFVAWMASLTVLSVMAQRFWDDYFELQDRAFKSGNSVMLEYKLLGPNGKLPVRKRESDAAWDVFSAERAVIRAGECRKISTELALAPPEGWYYTINGRSGLTSKGILVQRGIVDTGYTGEVGVVIYNGSENAYTISSGDRIGQLTLHKTAEVQFREVVEFSPEYSHRGESGWGSSGKA